MSHRRSSRPAGRSSETRTGRADQALSECRWLASRRPGTLDDWSRYALCDTPVLKCRSTLIVPYNRDKLINGIAEHGWTADELSDQMRKAKPASNETNRRPPPNAREPRRRFGRAETWVMECQICLSSATCQRSSQGLTMAETNRVEKLPSGYTSITESRVAINYFGAYGGCMPT
jgi:hypothetical protein